MLILGDNSFTSLELFYLKGKVDSGKQMLISVQRVGPGVVVSVGRGM